MISIMFVRHRLNYETNRFAPLMKANKWEDISNNRQAAILVDAQNGSIPIIRTTMGFTKPSQNFSEIHHELKRDIQGLIPEHSDFNNAMAEIYDPDYTKMSFHSDQNLDLAPNSHIAVFSCYQDKNELNPKRLIIKNKHSKKIDVLMMIHNSVIIFSTATNDEYVHKIVSGAEKSSSNWLGLTFRLSKTFVKYMRDSCLPYFISEQTLLRLATEEERREFCKYKRMQNQQVGFRYPCIAYTLSGGI